MARSTDLLLAAAEWLDDGRAPLTHEFLVEHDVTIDEAYALAEHLAIGARMFMQVQDELRQGGLAATVGGTRLVDAILAGEAAT